MQLVEINRLGVLAAVHWLDDVAHGRHRRLAASVLDAEQNEQRKADIQSAWSSGWNFGFRNSERLKVKHT